MRHAVDSRHRHLFELLIRSYPQLGMNLGFRNESAFENVTHEEVIVHRLRDDLCDSSRVELDETVVL